MIVEGFMSESKEEETTGGKKLLKFSVAHEFKEKRGEDVLVKTQWVECDLYNFKNSVKFGGKLSSPEMLEKGRVVRVFGRPFVNAWVDKVSGEIKSQLKCAVEKIELLCSDSEFVGL